MMKASKQACSEAVSMTKASRLGYLLLCSVSCVTGCSSNDPAGNLGGGDATSNAGSPAGETVGGASGAGANQGTGNAGATAGSSMLGGSSPGGMQAGDSSPGGSSAGGDATLGGGTAGSSTLGGAGIGGTEAGGSSPGGNPAGGDATGGSGDTAGSAAVGAGGGAEAAGGMPEDSGGSSGAAGGTSVTCPSGGWTPGDERVTLMHDGVQREYEVHIPQGYTGNTPVPLMMTIHGAHNTIAMVRSWSQMNSVSDENGFIVVYPQGIDCWNSGFTIGGCAAADDDVGFLRTVVSDVESNACIDPKRVYATGISNGSMMAQYLGCEAADLFAAVGGVSGGAGGTCSPARPISVFYVHGTVDRTIPYSSAQPNVDGWVNRNGCDSTPVETYNMGSTRCVTYQGCDDGVEVVFCTVTGMGHCWPEDQSCLGTGDSVDDFKMSPLNWEFFERHPLP